MAKAPKYELEDAVTTLAAEGYLRAVKHGVSEIKPTEALKIALSMYRTGYFGHPNLYEAMKSSDDGQQIFSRMGEAVLRKVSESQDVDLQV